MACGVNNGPMALAEGHYTLKAINAFHARDTYKILCTSGLFSDS